MPNYCNYQLKATGEKENLEKLHKIMNADYSYEEEKITCSEESHMFRIFEANIDELEDDYIIISGYCAWSVNSCMLDDSYSYYRRMKEEYGDNLKATTLEKLSKDLNLAIEIFSEEAGCGFMEHYLIKNGKFIVDKCVEYNESYDEETDTYNSTGGLEWEYSI